MTMLSRRGFFKSLAVALAAVALPAKAIPKPSVPDVARLIALSYSNELRVSGRAIFYCNRHVRDMLMQQAKARMAATGQTMEQIVGEFRGTPIARIASMA